MSDYAVRAAAELAELEHRLRERAIAYGADPEPYLEDARRRARETSATLAWCLRQAIYEMGDDWAKGAQG